MKLICFYLICLLASLLHAHARPISDMKSQPRLFVCSIPGAAPRLFILVLNRRATVNKKINTNIMQTMNAQRF